LGAFCDEGTAEETENRMTKEADVLQEVRLLSRGDVRLFRNSVGAFIQVDCPMSKALAVLHTAHIYARVVHCGLAVGSGDLIGWRIVDITDNHVGSRLAVFSSVECKGDRGKVTPEQEAFAHQVVLSGGIAGVVRSVEDARRLLQI
jgi:hypothetical protein